MIFPEVEASITASGFRGVSAIKGLQITVATTAKTKEEGKKLLELFGMPFQRGQ